MRRRQKPPARVYTLDDMPAYLRNFDPIDCGCFTTFQPDPDWQTAHAAWRAAHRQWLDEHHVNALEELRRRMNDRRAAMRAEHRGQ